MAPAALEGRLAGHRFFDLGRFFSNQVNTTLITLSFLILLIVAYRKRKTEGVGVAWWAFDVLLSTVVFVDGIKLLINMPRPNGGDLGFPSGHTAFAFSLSWLMLELNPALGAVFFVTAGAIGWSRVEVMAHFPYQVIAGGLFGIAIGWGATHLKNGILLPRLARIGRKGR
jgi:membrane-associated phospholipid phosphatase